MAAPGRRNHHEAWNEFRIAQLERFIEIGLPADLLSKQNVFEDFLTKGCSESADVKLDSLSQGQIGHLLRMANEWSSWPAEYAALERLRLEGRGGDWPKSGFPGS